MLEDICYLSGAMYTYTVHTAIYRTNADIAMMRQSAQDELHDMLKGDIIT